MDKYTWFIFVWNTPESGYYCHTWKVKNGDNLPAVIRNLMPTGGELVTMCAADNGKQARQIVEQWREDFRKNGKTRQNELEGA